MVQQLSPLGVRGNRQHAAAFHHRERRRSLADPALGLYGTHQFTSADNPIDSDGVFVSAVLPVTFECIIERGTVAGAGVVCEFGSVTRGGGVWVNGTSIGACAGGNAAANDGADIEVSGILNADGQQVLITAVIHPGTGVINLLADGRLVGAAVSVDGDFGTGWRDTDDGGVGALAGTISDRFAQAGAITNATIIGPVRAFYNQRPQAFHAAGLGTNGGLGSWTN